MIHKLQFKSISFKLGLLFSTLFIVLLLILGGILYGVFTNILIDYIEQDLLTRGNTHARVLGEDFSDTSINHVTEMEKGVTTDVMITNADHELISASSTIDKDMNAHLLSESGISTGTILENEWFRHDYIISVSPITQDLGYVYMYYPSSKLREIVMVMTVLIVTTGIGIILLAFGLIGISSKRITRPLLVMKEATVKMAKGEYRQHFPVKGEDEVAQLSHSIQALGDQLQEFEDSRNDFLAAVSHELRTPLTYIKGYSDILSKGTIKDKDAESEYLNIIKKEAQRVTFMVNDLFEMSKLQVGKFTLDKEMTSIESVIEKAAATLKPAAAKKGIDILVDHHTGVPKVKIDVKRMEQILYNLIENAIKYTNEGSVTIRSYKKPGSVVIEVRDTGVGIPEQDLPKIWDRFYRVDQSRTRKSGGTGLGLYVVKQIIEAHGGKVKAESTLNEGSVFTIYLNDENTD